MCIKSEEGREKGKRNIGNIQRKKKRDVVHIIGVNPAS
jgi:hypothetical protein